MRQKMKRALPSLTGIFLENFQSLRSPAYVKIAGITMLYGPNSAGKSSVIDALEFLRKINDDDDNNFKTEYLWRMSCNDDTRLGISYRAMQIDETDGPRQSNWLEREVNYSSPHIDFFSALKNKEVFFEVSRTGDTIRMGIEGKPLLEIYGFFQWRPYNENYTPATSDEEVEDAEAFDREIHGRLTVHHDNPYFESLLPSLRRFYLIASRQQGRRTSISKSTSKWKTQKIENSCDLQMMFEDHGSSFSIYGVELHDSWFGTGNRRFTVRLNDDAEGYLIRKDLKQRSKIYTREVLTKEQTTRLWLIDELNDISQLIDSIVEGLRYQVCKALKHCHVPGNRSVINSDAPTYSSKGFGYSHLVKGSENLRHVVLYAEARSEYAKSLKTLYEENPMTEDFVNEALARYMPSLSGYTVNADVHVSKPKFKKRARLHPWLPYNKNSLVFLNVQDSSGRILGFHEVGSGISYILPIFTSLWASTLSFIEQPELHLHPAAQCELGDVFIAAKNLGSFSVVESHSEHLLLRILRRVRETTEGKIKDKQTSVSCDDLRIYYFNPSLDQGTSVFEIRVDRFGELLSRWPGGFFAERDQELFS